ncbi:hypothetical protein D3C76_207340 [compost metagenome]
MIIATDENFVTDETFEIALQGKRIWKLTFRSFFHIEDLNSFILHQTLMNFSGVTNYYFVC